LSATTPTAGILPETLAIAITKFPFVLIATARKPEIISPAKPTAQLPEAYGVMATELPIVDPEASAAVETCPEAILPETTEALPIIPDCTQPLVNVKVGGMTPEAKAN
jgi:hypothetical protein